MKKLSARPAALLLALLFSVALIAGCTGETKETGTPSQSQPVSSPGTSGGDTEGAPNGGSYIETAPMPERGLSVKEVSYFAWGTLEDKWGSAPKSLQNLFKREFGITLTPVIVSYDMYWESLMTLVGAGTPPDLATLPNWNFYPTPITEDLLLPLDGLIDFSGPLWDSTRELRDANKWKGKTYVPFISQYHMTWFFFNKTMFNNYGLETPQDYYERGEWTWEKMQELADKFVMRDEAHEIVQWGVVFQTNDLIATTGLELVKMNEAGDGYEFNLKDPKIARMMNMFYDMGEAGTGSLYQNDQITGFRTGMVPMIGTNANVLFDEAGFNDMRRAGYLGWVPMPKMDEGSEHYNQIAFDPGYGIVKGAKNPEGAALFIEYIKWFHLGGNECPGMPHQRNAAAIKYNIENIQHSISKYTDDPKYQLTEAEIAYTQTLLDKNYNNISIMWQSWLGVMVMPGYGYVLTGAYPWSAALELVYPECEALLNSYFR